MESWRNINAIDNLVHEILTTASHLVVAGLRGNAGAGGAMLALAADHVFAREGVVLNPHYKGMGGLYGSEYWTYTLPRRVGQATAIALTEGCRPMGTREARAIGFCRLSRGRTGAHGRQLLRARSGLSLGQTALRIQKPNAELFGGTPRGFRYQRPIALTFGVGFLPETPLRAAVPKPDRLRRRDYKRRQRAHHADHPSQR